MCFCCGRMGSLDGLFVAEEEELDSIRGSEISFGEALGKHSDVRGSLDEGDISIVSEDQEKIEWLVEVTGGQTISGYNPLDYIEDETCYECEESEEYCECEEGFQL